MHTKTTIRTLIILSIVLVNVGCDQVSKKIVRDNVSVNETIGLLNDHITIMKVENAGAFLSLGDSLPDLARNILLSLIPMIVLTLGFIYILTKVNISNMIIGGFCFIMGGGIGNLYDRIVHGSVTDFLYINFGFIHTGVFNLADVSIMTGSFIILIHSFFKRKKSTL